MKGLSEYAAFRSSLDIGDEFTMHFNDHLGIPVPHYFGYSQRLSPKLNAIAAKLSLVFCIAWCCARPTSFKADTQSLERKLRGSTCSPEGESKKSTRPEAADKSFFSLPLLKILNRYFGEHTTPHGICIPKQRVLKSWNLSLNTSFWCLGTPPSS